MAAGLVALVVGFFFPGFGAAVAGQWRWAVGWAVAVVVLFVCALVTPWAVWLSLGARLAAAVQGGWQVYQSPERMWFGPATMGTACGHVLANLLVYSFVLEGFASPSSSMSPTLNVGDRVFADKLTPHLHSIERGDVIIFHYPCDEQRDYLKRVIGVGGDTIEVRCHIVYVNGKALPANQVAARTNYPDHDESNDRWLAHDVSEYEETLNGHTYHVYSDLYRTQPAQSAPARDFPQRGRGFVPSCSNAPDLAGRATAARTLSGTGKIIEDKPEGTAMCEPQLHYVVPPGTYFTMGDNRDNSNDSRVWGVVGEDAIIGRVTGIWLSKTHDYSWGRVGRID